ncbi:MAG: hypothetical protein WA192_13635 [Candidatus Acidiferrales bacterium]
MVSTKVPRGVRTAASAVHSANRDGARNLILLGLPAAERNALLTKLEFVALPTPIVLHDPGEEIA